MTAPTRPVLRWHGGKWKLAPWIIAQFPPHRVYVEPFGGAASVLLRKPRAHAEIYNDLDGDVVNLFRVLRGDRAGELIEALRLTPFARQEYDAARAPTGDEVERARRLVIRSYMGFGTDAHNIDNNSGFRANAVSQNNVPSRDWANYPEKLGAIIDRLAGVVIDNRDAVVVMAQHDRSGALFYLDPPYLPATRSPKMRSGAPQHAYAFELDEPGHEKLLAAASGLAGAVIISGYASALYDDALSGWRRLERKTLADHAADRTEILWINRAADAAHGLFSNVKATGHG